MAIGIVVVASSCLWAAQTPTSPENPQQLVQAVIKNELQAQDQDHTHWMYESREEESDGKQVRRVVETRQGVLYRILAVKGRALSAAEQQEEDARIQKLLKDPREYKKQQQAQDQDAKKARQMMEMLPKAFTYRDAGKEKGYTRLTFVPNPAFDPPTREARVLHSMEGEMLIDPAHKRLKRLRGVLAKTVEFGGGLLGHLDKGGTFTVEQSDVGDGHWEVTLTDVHIMGKVLFFKSIHEQEHQVSTNFRRVSDDLDLAQAAELLVKPPSGATSTASLKSLQ